MKVIPSTHEIVREALILIGGAILAALILSQAPRLREWITTNTRGGSGSGGCSCGG